MSPGEVTQISEGIYAYLQPDGTWYLNNTGFLMDVGAALADMVAYHGRPLTCHA